MSTVYLEIQSFFEDALSAEGVDNMVAMIKEGKSKEEAVLRLRADDDNFSPLNWTELTIPQEIYRVNGESSPEVTEESTLLHIQSMLSEHLSNQGIDNAIAAINQGKPAEEIALSLRNDSDNFKVHQYVTQEIEEEDDDLWDNISLARVPSVLVMVLSAFLLFTGEPDVFDALRDFLIRTLKQ